MVVQTRMSRRFFPALAAVLVAGGWLVVLAGCDSQYVGAFLTADALEDRPAVTDATAANTVVPPSLIIGSFNIQTFGRSKMGKPEVVPVLVDIVHRFDILAIQELRDKDQRTIPEFIDLINRDGSNYRAAVSRRVGYQDRTTNRHYEEQMVYVYDANRVEILGQPYVAEDRYAMMHRPPYVAHFRSRILPVADAFSFVLMNVHVDPDDTVAEFTALQGIIHELFPRHPGEDDFILLGDLNDDASEFTQYNWLANQAATIPPHWKTNTRQDKSYDNIVLDTGRTAEFTNQCGVINLLQEYQIDESAALKVSDHMPVWAVFSSRESNQKVASQSSRSLR